MVGRSNAVSGENKYGFTYNYQAIIGSETPTLNGQTISVGETVKIAGGTINVLYSPAEGMRIATENGTEIPRVTIEQPQTTRASSLFYYLQFVMPSQNVSVEYLR